MNVIDIAQMFQNVFEEIQAHPMCVYTEGEPQEVTDHRIAKFWAHVRDRKAGLIPDNFFAYMRDDHPSIAGDRTWPAFLKFYGGAESGLMATGCAIFHFKHRADPRSAPVYDNIAAAEEAVGNVAWRQAASENVLPALKGNVSLSLIFIIAT